MKRSFYARYAVLILLGMVLTLPWIGFGVVGAVPGSRYDLRDWLPSGFTETRTYRWFLEHFGGDEVAVVSWEGATLDDERVERLAQALTGEEARESPRLFERAMTGPEALRLLTAPPLSIPEVEALRRLRGALVGPDGRTTAVVLFLSQAGTRDRPAAVERICEVAESACGLARDDLRLGGPTVYGAAMDVEVGRSLGRLGPISLAIGLLAAWLLLRSIRLALIVFLGSVYAAAGTVACLYWTGHTLHQTLPILPPLVYLLSISGSIHLINYYRDAVRDAGPAGAPEHAVARGWLPCALAAGTTAIGMLSLLSSRTLPVWTFGLYAAMGMGISLVVVLLLLPAALQLLPGRPVSRPESADRSARAFDSAAACLSRYHAPVAAVGVVLIVLLGAGMLRLHGTIRMQDRFEPDSRLITDYRWLESKLGPLVPLEIVVRFGSDCTMGFLERMETISSVQHEVEGIGVVTASTSAATFAPVVPRGQDPGSRAYRLLLEQGLVAARKRFADAHYLAEENGEQLWRINVRVNALGDTDYGRLLDDLRRRVDALLSRSGAPVSAIYTGAIPLMRKAQYVLLDDLVDSFCLAFAVIALVMIVSLRNLPAGLLAMLPNLFPTVVIFGAMGWLAMRINIGSVVTASVALGIAVDGTFHYLTWFRRGRGEGMSRREAVRTAYRRCAGAMISTTIICVAGLLVFVGSTFVPTVRFAWLMAALLIAALAGDLVLLPAILAGPLGRWFRPRKKPTT
jgi:uncharacterized protein